MNYQKHLEEFNKKDRFSVENGIRLTELRPGYAEAELIASLSTRA